MERFRTLAILACLALSACGTPTLDVQVQCLPMATYTAAQQAQMAQEWAALAPASLTASLFIPDAITLRDANRAACTKAAK
jgi:hypothetical protein